MSEAATADRGRDVQHLSSVLLGAVLVGAVAAWVAALLADPVVVFPAAAAMTGVVLDRRRGERGKLVLVGYAVAALLAVSPALFFLPDLLAGRTGVVSQVMTVVVARLLWLAAGLVAYVTYRLDGGRGVLDRARRSGARGRLVALLVAAGLVVLPVGLFVLDFVAGTTTLELVGVVGWRLLALAAVGLVALAVLADRRG